MIKFIKPKFKLREHTKVKLRKTIYLTILLLLDHLLLSWWNEGSIILRGDYK
jgi:hypothetical protein